MPTRYRCPVDPTPYDDGDGEMTGCGSWDTTQPDKEGLVDCDSCGMWFNPKRELHLETREEIN